MKAMKTCLHMSVSLGLHVSVSSAEVVSHDVMAEAQATALTAF